MHAGILSEKLKLKKKALRRERTLQKKKKKHCRSMNKKEKTAAPFLGKEGTT